MLATTITTKFGLEYPVLSAPMSRHSGAAARRSCHASRRVGFVRCYEPRWCRLASRRD